VSAWLDTTTTPRTAAELEAEIMAAQMCLLGNVIAPVHPHLIAASTSLTANDARGMRMVMPRSGTLKDFAIWIATTSGNVDVGIYDTVSGTAGKLWSSTSTACGTVNTWQVVGDPNLAVTRGQHVDFVIGCDNATAAFGRVPPPVNPLLIQLPTNFMPSPQGALPKFAWRASASFPLPTSFTEAAKTITSGQVMPFMMCRIV
jgi:hypothetical protein